MRKRRKRGEKEVRVVIKDSELFATPRHTLTHRYTKTQKHVEEKEEERCGLS